MNILNPNFKYTHSSKTDIRKTFERIKKQLKSDQVSSLDKPLVVAAKTPPGAKTLADFEELLGPRIP